MFGKGLLSISVVTLITAILVVFFLSCCPSLTAQSDTPHADSTSQRPVATEPPAKPYEDVETGRYFVYKESLDPQAKSYLERIGPFATVDQANRKMEELLEQKPVFAGYTYVVLPEKRRVYKRAKPNPQDPGSPMSSGSGFPITSGNASKIASLFQIGAQSILGKRLTARFGDSELTVEFRFLGDVTIREPDGSPIAIGQWSLKDDTLSFQTESFSYSGKVQGNLLVGNRVPRGAGNGGQERWSISIVDRPKEEAINLAGTTWFLKTGDFVYELYLGNGGKMTATYGVEGPLSGRWTQNGRSFTARVPRGRGEVTVDGIIDGDTIRTQERYVDGKVTEWISKWATLTRKN